MIHDVIHDCAQFDAWLDGGLDASLATEARAHAAGCTRCAGTLELESLLAGTPVERAGAAFTESVLLRVRDAGRARVAVRLALPDTEAQWWLRAPAEPSAALALVAAALLAWRGDGLWSFALELSARTRSHDWTWGPGSGLLDAIGHLGSALPSGTLGSGALLAVLLPVVGIVSWVLYRSIERWVDRACSRPAGAWMRGAPRPLPRALAAHE